MKLVMAVVTCAVLGCGSKSSEKDIEKELDKAFANLDKDMKADMKGTGRARATEAQLQLDRIGKLAKTSLIEKAEFPKGKVGPTPATDCCASGGCKADAAAWADPAWKALEFSIDEAHGFQYTYESDGKTFTATAIGCGDHAGTWKASGHIEAGNPVVEVSGP